jgi:hypothetical protein
MLDDSQPATLLSAPPSGAIPSDAIDETAATQPSLAIPARTDKVPRAQRETGDQVNRFLFCALVSESAKDIKRSAADVGEPLPMPMIVRGVLRSYRLAAADRYGALAEPEVNYAGLRRLNRKILQEETARHSSDRVKVRQRQLACAKQLGDDTRIKAEEDGLKLAIELRDRLTERFR